MKVLLEVMIFLSLKENDFRSTPVKEVDAKRNISNIFVEVLNR